MEKSHVRIVSENVCAISYINKAGGTILELNELAKTIWTWCVEKEIHISAGHIPGIDTVDADYLSRSIQTSGEWSLDVSLFERICRHFFFPDIDLFASRLNFKISRFVS